MTGAICSGQHQRKEGCKEPLFCVECEKIFAWVQEKPMHTGQKIHYEIILCNQCKRTQEFKKDDGLFSVPLTSKTARKMYEKKRSVSKNEQVS